MKTHAVIEVEEGGMTLTIGEQHDASLQIQRCERVQTGDVSAESVATAMASFGPDAFAGARGVHVVVGDRRAHHFVTTTPKMPNGEVVNYVIREALRVSGLRGTEELLVAPRFIRTLSGGRLTIAVTALPHLVWHPFEVELESRGVPVLGLHTMESCLALAAPAMGEQFAL